MPTGRRAWSSRRGRAGPRTRGAGRCAGAAPGRRRRPRTPRPRTRRRGGATCRARGRSRTPARTRSRRRRTRPGSAARGAGHGPPRGRGAPVVRCVRAASWRHGPTTSRSRTSSHPVGVPHVVSRIIVPGRYRRPAGTVRPSGPTRKRPAWRSRIAENTLGPSIRGSDSHSTLPAGATSAHTSQSESRAYSAIGGKGLPPSGMSPSGPSRLGTSSSTVRRLRSTSKSIRSPSAAGGASIICP